MLDHGYEDDGNDCSSWDVDVNEDVNADGKKQAALKTRPLP